jgi:hypothetical protein
VRSNGPACAWGWAEALQRWAGAERKWVGKIFPIFKFLLFFDFSGKWNNNWNKYLGISEKCETLHGDRFEYLPQLLYWAL